MIKSDNGPSFQSSEFKQFMKENEIKRVALLEVAIIIFLIRLLNNVT